MSNELESDLNAELKRIDAQDVDFVRDDDFAPDVGTLLKVTIGQAEWRFNPTAFLDLVREVPDSAGSEALKRVIEQQATFVWHGPQPPEDRDRPQSATE